MYMCMSSMCMCACTHASGKQGPQGERLRAGPFLAICTFFHPKRELLRSLPLPLLEHSMQLKAAVMGGLALLAGQASSAPMKVYEQAVPVGPDTRGDTLDTRLGRLSDDVLLTHLSADTLSTQKSEQMVSDEQKAEEEDRVETIRKLRAKLEASEALLHAMDKQLATVTATRNSRMKKTLEYRRVLSGFDGEGPAGPKDQAQGQAKEQANGSP